jgi:hypothetical protein
VGDYIRLVENWLDALNAERERSGEVKKLRLDTQKYKRERIARRLKIKANRAPSEAEMDAAREAREERERQRRQHPVSLLAAVLHEYLYHDNPHDACQPPGWLAVTVWALKLYPGKPTPEEVTAALAELGGDTFRRDCLEKDRIGANERSA